MQQYIYRYFVVAIAAVIFVAASFFFIRWLYLDNSSEQALQVFDYKQDTDKIEKYSGNLYINIINSVIPAAKAGFEERYGQDMPGFASNISSKLFNGVDFDIKDPKTYFSFVFTAFSQYDPSNTQVSFNEDDKKELPDITNFEDAPEGAIYFSEEDEYLAEEAAGQSGDTPAGDITDKSNTIEETENLGDPSRVEIEKKQPSILLLHSHSMESYSPYSANNYHSLNDKQNVVMVGNVMTDVLESKYKFNVIHDKTRHDEKSYAYSYGNSLQTIKSQLNRNKSLQVYLDVHRDAFAVRNDAESKMKKNEYTVSVKGKNAARVMLVIGQANPNYTELKKFAVYVQKEMDKLYPGLFMKIVTKPGKKYNQYFMDHSLLIEVGCTLNTDAEAKYSAELMGNVIGGVLKNLEQ